MASNWYYNQNGNQHGPVSRSELKQLAASGKLLPSDQVWKEGMTEWKSASKVKDLFLISIVSAPSPPPLPKEAKETPVTKVAPLPTQRNSKGTFTDHAISRRQDFIETAHQAKELGQAHARKLKITKSMLPKAYLALGKVIYERKWFQDEFADHFQKLNGKPDDRSLLRELGRRGFEVHGKDAGPPEIVSHILDYRGEIESLDTKIERLSAEGGGKVLTPKRLMFGGLGLLGFMVLMMLSAMFNGGSSLSGSKDTSVTADFLPYKKGARAVYFIEMIQPGGEAIVAKHVYDHPGDGVVKHVVESMGTMRNGEYVSERRLNQSLSDDHWRKNNGFIETQSGSAEWVAALKLGGKVGDSWKSIPGIGQARIESFGTYTLRYDGKKYQSVVVSERLEAGQFTTLSKSVYVEDIGLLEKSVYKIDDGAERLISRWRLEIPEPDWNLTKSERRMFE